MGTPTRAGAPLLRNVATGEIRCEDHMETAPARPAAQRAPPAIQVQALSKRYGSRLAVDSVSFDVPRARVVGFVGPNGAGKTTTLRMLLGLIRPTGGTATVLGESIATPGRYLGRVGALIESPAFYPALSGRRNLRALAVLGGHDARRVDELLHQVGLADRGDHPFKSYSLGMKQRLGIAASLIPDPELLILDEPTNGLDPAGILEVRQFLRRLGDQGKTVFVSSHLLGEIQRMCDRLVVLRLGKLVFDGTVDELEQRTKGVMVTATSPTDHARLAEIYRSAGFPVVEAGGSLHVDAPSAIAPDLNVRAMKAGIVLRELRPRAFDLEETILDMTGREAVA